MTSLYDIADELKVKLTTSIHLAVVQPPHCGLLKLRPKEGNNLSDCVLSSRANGCRSRAARFGDF